MSRARIILKYIAVLSLFTILFGVSAWTSHTSIQNLVVETTITPNGQHQQPRGGGRLRKDDAYYDTGGTWGTILDELEEVQRLKQKLGPKKKNWPWVLNPWSSQGMTTTTAVTGLRVPNDKQQQQQHKGDDSSGEDSGTQNAIDTAAIFEKLRGEYNAVHKYDQDITDHTLDTNQEWKASHATATTLYNVTSATMHQDVTNASNSTTNQEEKAKEETYEKAVGNSSHDETINYVDDDAIEDGDDNDASEKSDSPHDAIEQDTNNTMMSVVTTTKRKKEINKTTP
eukprot:15359795-Ditylum_brightwellii.AAC.1